MTVIYADTVFLMNTALDYLLLRSVASLTASPVSRLRLGLGGAAGGLYAVLVFLPGVRVLNAPLLRLGWSGLLVALAFGVRRGTLRRWGVFLALSGALAGMLVLVAGLSAQGLDFPRGIPATKLDGKALLLSGSLCLLLCSTALHRLAPARGRELVPVRLYWGGRSASLTVLSDSGNLLTDSTGRPVLVAELDALRALFPEPLDRSALEDPTSCFARYAPLWEGRLQLLPCRTLGVSLLLALRTDRAVIEGREVPGQVVALCAEPFSGGAYQGVLNTEQEGFYGKKTGFAHPTALGTAAAGPALHRRQ